MTSHPVRAAAVLMIAAAVLVNVAFTGLVVVFDYPDVLKYPAAEVLASFRANQGPVVGWFLVLALGAALLAPVALGVGRLSDAPTMRWAVRAGVAAAVVQVVGLLRWPLLVPGWAATAVGDDPAAAAAAQDAFVTAHVVLGTVVGETGGYVLTAAWTVLVLAALDPTRGGRPARSAGWTRRGRIGHSTAFAGRLFVALGAGSAALILLGVASPLGLPFVDLANFVGYVLWSGWLVIFGGVLLVRGRRAAGPGQTSPPVHAACR